MTTATKKRTPTADRGVFFEGDDRLEETWEAIQGFGSLVQLAIEDDLFTEEDLAHVKRIEEEATYLFAQLKLAREQVASLPKRQRRRRHK